MDFEKVSNLWKKEFLRVDQWGRSMYRTFFVGIGLLAVAWICEQGSIKLIYILGFIGIGYSLLAPTLATLYKYFKNQTKSKKA